MGAKIEGMGTHTLRITGSDHLRGAEHTIIPDHNEAATFLILGVATKSPILVKNARVEHLDIVLEKLREFGADFEVMENEIRVIPTETLRAVSKIDTRPYPGFPSDIVSLVTVLATQAQGQTLVHDWMYELRLFALEQLSSMRADLFLCDPHRIIVSGPTKLRGRTLDSRDIRSGMALIAAALVAEGKSTVLEIETVERGYGQLVARLRTLGADVERID